MRVIFTLIALFGTFASTYTTFSRTTVSKVFELDKVGTWFENLAVSEAGYILATRADVPEVWKIDPIKEAGSRLVEIPQLTTLMGITEVHASEFVVAGTNVTETGAAVPGSSQAWKLDLRSSSPEVSLITTFPHSGRLKGITKANAETILLADSTAGVIYKLDLRTNDIETALSDPPTMTFPQNASLPYGVNGVKTLHEYVYYTNTARKLFCRIPVDSQFHATGPSEVIASGFIQDDFALLPDGTAYIAAGAQNTVLEVTSGGQVSVAAGSLNSSQIPSATSVQMGRKVAERSTLYVTDSGAQLSPINGTLALPASIVAIHLEH
ncbi:hypothetical protein F5Y16DRAFT_417410 [Xylariaceae sp. FL0255]|nr:hypothetical protein F5Y16DRAFT_417410 [Xylariaceae sp. FL0255]